MSFASEPPGGTGEGAIAVSSDGARIVWNPRGTGPHFSTDGGATWSGSLPTGPLAVDRRRSDLRAIVAVNAAPAIGFGSAAPGATYPAVRHSGSVGDPSGLYRSDDGGATWVAIHDSRSRFGFINHVSGDPRPYGRVYLGTGGRGIILRDPIEAP
jgi:hypothetical protein